MAKGFLGNIVVGLTARTGAFQANMAKASKSMFMFRGQVGRMPAAINLFNKSLLGLFGAGSALGYIGRVNAASDQTGKFAKRIGIAVEDISRFQFAAERGGVAVSALQMGLQRMVRRLGEAAKGVGEARGAIKRLGLDAKKLETAGPAEAFLQISQALSKVESSFQRTALAQKIFDSEGVALIQIMEEGRKGIEDLARLSDRLGATLTTRSAKGAAQAADSMTEMQASVRGLTQDLSQMAGVITVAANSFRFLLSASRGVVGGVLGTGAAVAEAATFGQVETISAARQVFFDEARLNLATAGSVVGNERAEQMLIQIEKNTRDNTARAAP